MRQYHAVRLGGCLRAVVAEQLGYEALAPSESVQRLWDEGLLHEKDVLDKYYPDASRQFELRLLVTEDAEIVGHPDGMDDEKVIEVKSLSPDMYTKGFSHTVEMYRYQTSCYGLMSGLPVLLIEKDRNSGAIRETMLRDDLEFGTGWHPFERVREAEKWVEKGELPPCDKIPSFPCRYKYLEDPEELVQLKPKPTEASEICRVLAHNYLKWRNERDQIDKLLDATRKSLDKGLGESKSVETGEAVVYRFTTNRVIYDTKQAVADGVDLSKYEKKVTTTTVAVRKKESGKNVSD